MKKLTSTTGERHVCKCGKGTYEVNGVCRSCYTKAINAAAPKCSKCGYRTFAADGLCGKCRPAGQTSARIY